MGLLQHLKRLSSKRSSSSPPRIKLVHTDGHIQHLHGPLSAKDLLPLHPGHGLFVSENISSRLTDSALLHPGHVYYLKALLPRQVSDSKLNARASGGGKAANHGGDRHVTFASSPLYIEPANDEISVQDEDDSISPAIDDVSHAVDSLARVSRKSAATGVAADHLDRVSDAAMSEEPVKPDDHGQDPAEKHKSTVKIVVTRRQYEMILQGAGEEILDAALHRPVHEGCRVPRSHSSPHISAAAISV